MTDGYKSYDGVLSEAKIPHAYCWAHVRRELLPLEDHVPNVKPIIDLIDKIFAVEREAISFCATGIPGPVSKTEIYISDSVN